jgi:sigma-B regulation protein RsbU (phosphoserine phosphatase)
MRRKRDNTATRISITAGMLVVLVAAATLAATSFIQGYYSSEGIKREASGRAMSELEGARSDIMDIVDQAEAAVRNNLWIAQWCLERPDSLYRVPQRVVLDNPVVVGSTIALVPNYKKGQPAYVAPYAVRDLVSGKIQIRSLATEEYDYPSQEWFEVGLYDNDGYWSEPYYDIGGGEQYMTTFSMPVTDMDGKTAGVLTADISLDWLTSVAKDIKIYPHSVSTLTSRDGNTLIMAGDMPADDEKYQTYSVPVERTGWTLSLTLPEEDLFESVNRMEIIVRMLQLLGLAMLILILRVVAKNVTNYHRLNEQKERMQSELRIGRDIQMSMVPKTSPPFSDAKALDFAASIVPAKDVGGDLYDYYIRDEKLYFCIGDVSGKGVPAALVMTVTRTLFRAISSHESSPARLVYLMNNYLSESNENEMFVTFFMGVLNLSSGRMRYCNAGHNPPLILTDTVSELPVKPNLSMGVMLDFPYEEQEITLHQDDALFLYTDGLSEAEDAQSRQFGMQRIEEILHTRRDAQKQLSAMQTAVNAFVGDAPQSDDLTMLLIHYLGQVSAAREVRHLTLHNDIQQIHQLETFVEAIALEKNLDPGLALNLNLALEEAVTNVITYAYPKGTDGLVEIEAVIREKAVGFVITDSGTPFDPTARPDADITLSVEERPIGGLGIHLVRQIMDEVHYDWVDGKNRLTLIKKL